MHKRRIIICFILLLLFLVQTVYADNLFTKIDVIFNQMDLFVNGQKVETDNILYNGTTYVPLRKVAEMLGKDVAWDEATNSVNITDRAFQNVGNIQTMEYEDGSIYTGEVNNGIPNGFGVFYFASGDRYAGVIDNNEFTGDGVLYWTTGDKYVGGLRNGDLFGFGTRYFNNGTISTGMWNNNKLDICGVVLFPDDNVYIGELKNDIIEGTGIYSYSTGEKIVGEFKDNEYVGPINVLDTSLINVNFGSNSTVYSGLGPGHWIMKKMDFGQYIQLEDGSLWEISSMDKYKTSIWLKLNNITVIESKNALYPYILVNTDQGETAEAKLVSK